MTELEMALVVFINEFHRKSIYRYEEYQMLHNVKYRTDMSEENLESVRKKYHNNCYEAAYELKTYYMENGLLSNTIVLKMRPETPELQELRNIKIHSELDGLEHEYTHHAIEIFKEHGKYKVLDILHRDKTVWLENYLDDVCRANECPRERLRYDMGYLAPCHAFAGNMQELSDLMRYLDKKYDIGKPRFNLMNTAGAGSDAPNGPEYSCLLSDDMVMDFDAFGREFAVTGREVMAAYRRVYDRLMGVRFSILHLLCQGHIMRDPIVSHTLAEGLFDDEKVCYMMEEASRQGILK